MRFGQTRLYSFAAPFALLPLMDASFSQIGDFVRTYLQQQMANLPTVFASLIVSLIQGMIHPVIDVIIRALFGVR